MMRLTGQKIFDATQVLATIINEKRPMTSKGTYRVTKMHRVLFPEFTMLNEARSAKIASYDHLACVLPDGTIVPDDGMSALLPQPCVPPDKMPEFVVWWHEIASVESDVNIDPIPIDQLGVDGAASSLTFAEFAALGDLVEG